LTSDDEDDAKSSLRKHAQNLLQQVNDDKNNHVNENKKGIMGLKFMQRGVEKKRLIAEKEANNLLRAIENDGDSDDEVDDSIKMGRRSLGPKNKNSPSSKPEDSNERKDKEKYNTENDKDENDGSESITKTSKSSGFVKASNLFNVPSFKEIKKPTENSMNTLSDGNQVIQSDNPWLAVQKSSSTRNKNKSSSSKEKEVAVNLDGVLKNTLLRSMSNQKKTKKTVKDSEENESRKEQTELLKRAFVNAGVAQEDFDAEMDAIEDNQVKPGAPKEMAGWGSWTGTGVIKRKADRPSSNPQSKLVVKKSRKRVIVSEKRNKKFAKYLVEKVPYPFTSREQYERSLANPLGNDWNTMGGFKDVIKPAVTTKAGTIIDPIQKGKTVGAKAS